MNTRILMISSALVMAAIGLSLSFAPEEVSVAIGNGTSGPWTIILQLSGALYCGCALMNWMTKGATLGGIYGRPIVIGNMVHFTVGGLAIVKMTSIGAAHAVWWTLAGLYILFAALFAHVMLTHPTKSDAKT